MDIIVFKQFMMKMMKEKFFFYSWTDYLKKLFKPLQGISKYHHFIFNQEEPGIIWDWIIERGKLLKSRF